MKFKLLILSLLALSLSACFSKRAQKDHVTEDITRPPEIQVSSAQSIEIPKKAGETVSYEQWLRENGKDASVNSGASEALE